MSVQLNSLGRPTQRHRWHFLAIFLLCLFQSNFGFAETEENFSETPTTTEVTVEATGESKPNYEFLVTTKKGVEYSFPSPTEEEVAGFLELEPHNQERFLKNREMVLKGATTVLNKLALPMGWWAKKVSDKFKKKEDRIPKDVSAREVGETTMREHLRNLDKELWLQAPVISQAHEFGGSIEIGVSGGGQVGKYGLFGLTGLGLTFAVDPTNKAFVVELYQDFERARRVDPFYFGAGVFMSFLGSGTYHNWNEPLMPEAGHAMCIPGLAACITRNNFRAGFSEELGLGFPQFAAFSGQIGRVPIMRIGISPKWKGFVRAKTFVLPLLKLVKNGVVHAVKAGCQFTYRALSSVTGGPKP